MDALSLGMQNLRVSQFFLENRPPDDDDHYHLQRGVEFLDQVLGAMLYIEKGETQGIENNPVVCFHWWWL